MDPMIIGLIVVVLVAIIYGAKKLIAHEDHQNERADTVRDNNTEKGVQEIKKRREI